MIDPEITQKSVGVKRARLRKSSIRVANDEIVGRVNTFYSNDEADRGGQVDRRIQRYAKYRMWSSGKNYPWEECSDVAIADMAAHSLRFQDTLYNSVVTLRPIISADPVDNRQDEDKQKNIDNLIDFQIFNEADGDTFISDLVESFVNDECATVYTPWVEDFAEITDISMHPEIPGEIVPGEYFKGILMQKFQDGNLFRKDKEGWDWVVEFADKSNETIKASFYTKNTGEVELVYRQNKKIFDGPNPIVIEWENIICPARCANLQPPGPSNPRGASHVIVRDYPTIDEVIKLQKSGFYDKMTAEDVEKLTGGTTNNSEESEMDRVKDNMAGNVRNLNTPNANSQNTVTRLVCFDRYDIDGDGKDEDVVWWVIYEYGILAKAKVLTEMFPSDKPRRPFAEASFIPVMGRRDGVSLLEILETTHDVMKVLTDQTVDAGTITNSPFFFYRPTSSMREEVIRISPGEGYPLNEPANDVYFPTMPQSSQAFGINMLTLFGSQQDRLAMQGDLQFGRVPAGKASALRTQGAQENLLAQSEARPERVLRRLFTCLTEVWAQIHELNKRFLPAQKKFKISGYVGPEDDPYRRIDSRDQLVGRFDFKFTANAFNSSKQALQNVYAQLMQTYVNPIAVQLGLVGPDEVYRLLKDFGKALGQDPEKEGYIRAPTPFSDKPPILAEEAITLIANGQIPEAPPLEGLEKHLTTLIEFSQSEDFGILDPSEVQIFSQYVSTLRQQLMAQTQMQQLAQALGGQQAPGQPQGRQGNAGQGSERAPTDAAPPVSGGDELIDESLPGAR